MSVALEARLRYDLTRMRWLLAVSGLAVSALMLAACSSGSTSPPVAHLAVSSNIATSANDGIHLAGECLREHGLANFPDPAVVADGPAAGRVILDKSALKNYPVTVVNQAMTACSVVLDQAGLLTGQGSAVSPQEIQERLALARCIRAHGVSNFPDPNPTTGDVTPPPGLTKTSPSILAALTACATHAQAAGITVPSSTP
jgi:hypothetical protein